MATARDLNIPTSPVNVTVRPLKRGMVTSETSMTMPDGSFQVLKGFVAGDRGPKRMGGWNPAVINTDGVTSIVVPLEFSDERIEDVAQLQKTDGTAVSLVVSNRCIYVVDRDTGYSVVYWMAAKTIATRTTGATTTTLTVTGDFRQEYHAVGDYVVIGSEKLPVETVTATASTLTLVCTGFFTSLPAVGSTFRVLKPFQAQDDYYVDFTTARNYLFLVDGSTPLVFAYTGTNLGPFILKNDAGDRTLAGARSISYFGDRLYFGNVIEFDTPSTTKNYPQRIRWSEVVDWTVCKSANYQDLVRTQGIITKFSGMGNLAIIYLSDSMYYGRQTNLSGLPYAFYMLETGGITALGMKSLASTINEQVFVGQNNIYVVNADATIQPIGDAIAETMLDAVLNPSGVYVRSDPFRSQIIVGIPAQTVGMSILYHYNLRTKAWSTSAYQTWETLAVLQFIDVLYWFEIPNADTWASTPLRYRTWRSLTSGTAGSALVAFQTNKHMLEYDENATQDTAVLNDATFLVRPIEGEIITPDFDFGEADMRTSVLRFGLKINDPNIDNRTVPIRHRLSVSNDRGRTWKYVGTLNIRAGTDEDALDFRTTGSTTRFKIEVGTSSDTSDLTIRPYEWAEITMRVRLRSREAIYGNIR